MDVVGSDGFGDCYLSEWVGFCNRQVSQFGECFVDFGYVCIVIVQYELCDWQVGVVVDEVVDGVLYVVQEFVCCGVDGVDYRLLFGGYYLWGDIELVFDLFCVVKGDVVFGDNCVVDFVVF